MWAVVARQDARMYTEEEDPLSLCTTTTTWFAIGHPNQPIDHWLIDISRLGECFNKFPNFAASSSFLSPLTSLDISGKDSDKTVLKIRKSTCDTTSIVEISVWRNKLLFSKVSSPNAICLSFLIGTNVKIDFRKNSRNQEKQEVVCIGFKVRLTICWVPSLYDDRVSMRQASKYASIHRVHITSLLC